MSLRPAVQRGLDVLAFALGATFVASMTRLAFTLSTWPFRLLAAAVALWIASRLVQVALSLKRSGWDPQHGVTKHLP